MKQELWTKEYIVKNNLNYKVPHPQEFIFNISFVTMF